MFFSALWYFVLLPATSNNLVNGSFEARLVGWGTGWLEDFPAYRGAARLNQYLATRNSQTGQLAVADWRSDPTEHRPGGRFALLIEHRSDKQTEVYSTLAQRIRVKPQTGYNVRFWAKVDRMEHDGDLWLSPNGGSVAWDEPKIEVSGAGKGWQLYRLDFNTGRSRRPRHSLRGRGAVEGVGGRRHRQPGAGGRDVAREGRRLARVAVGDLEVARAAHARGGECYDDERPGSSLASTPGRIAQLEERGPYKAEVPGSIPGPPTRKINRANSLAICVSESLPNFDDAVRGWK